MEVELGTRMTESTREPLDWWYWVPYMIGSTGYCM